MLKRILYIAPELRGKSGGSYACLAYYNALCKAFPDMVDAAISEEYCKGVDSGLIPVPKRSKIKALLSGSIHRYKSFIYTFLKNNPNIYSVCVVNFSTYAGDIIDILHSYGVKVAVIHHNYEKEYHMTTKSSLTLGGRFPYFIAQNEKKAYHNADLNMFLTRQDMESLKENYGRTNKECQLLGVFEPRTIQLTSPKAVRGITLIITGGLSDYQTYRSIQIFGQNYLSCALDKYPIMKVIISGRNPDESIYLLKDKYPQNISIIANPEDMNTVIDQGNIYFCPTCMGSGLKLRVMDGLRKGLPVLVHKVSSRGYEAFSSKPYFQVYDNVDAFMDGLKNIVTYIDSHESNCKECIFEDYNKAFGFEEGVQKMKRLLLNLVQ